MQWTGVSVPFRGFYLLNTVRMLHAASSMSFRPLPGFLSSQYDLHSYATRYRALVSVPFRGFYLLNSKMRKLLREYISFRPLPGFLSSQSGDDLWNKCFESFPSPSGVSIFSINNKGVLKRNCFVSVPFRGFYLLNNETRTIVLER